MPTLRRPCPGCKTTLIASPATRCPSCARGYEQARGKTSQRGYGARWQRLARLVVARDPVCTLCGVRPSTEADHVTPKHLGGSDDLDNLRGTCKPCNAGRR